MGIVVDRKQAEHTPCTCYRTDKGNKPEDLMCFSEGVMGTLSNGQDRMFCKTRLTKGKSEKFAEHIKAFKEWANVADKCLEENVDTWRCVEEEAKKRQ